MAIGPGTDVTNEAMVVDAHHHIWDPEKRRHAWLDAAPPPLRRRFDLGDFAAQAAGAGVVSSVLVQALASMGETEDLLDAALGAPVVAGVVGWVDLEAPDVADALATLVEHPGAAALVGIRHLVQNEPDPRWLERPPVLRGLRAVAKAGLAYDLLVRTPQLPAALVAVDAVEEGRFVLDHGAKPEIGTGLSEPWWNLIGELARRPHVVCKLSGLVTEAGPQWTAKAIAPYVERLLGTFGPERLLFGSDWPVCTAVATYGEVVDLAGSLLRERLGADERAKVMATNAVETYRLPRRPP